MLKNYKIFALVACLLSVTACEGTKEQLGLTRTVPDEYAIIKRAPLEMPPDYSLRPPEPGAPRPQEMQAAAQAEMVVFGQSTAPQNRAPGDGASALLQRAGADQSQPGIREQVDRETSGLAPDDEAVAERLLGWAGGTDQAPASVVDAEAEAARLQKNAAEGRPLNDGQTPTIED